MMNRRLALLLAFATAVLLGGCRGQIKKETPIHPQWNMDQVKRFDAQEPNPFFADNRAARPYVEGTVRSADPRGDADPCVLPEANPHLCEGKTADDSWATTMPKEVPLDAALLDRGQERYDIYCSPCHDRVGTADGMVARRGMKPITLHNEIVRSREAGKLYDIVANGGSLMPAYGDQIPVTDRWAIAAYVRALQISQHAPADVVPDDLATSKGWR